HAGQQAQVVTQRMVVGQRVELTGTQREEIVRRQMNERRPLGRRLDLSPLEKFPCHTTVLFRRWPVQPSSGAAAARCASSVGPRGPVASTSGNDACAPGRG